MARAIELLPDVEPGELEYLEVVISNMTDETAKIFASSYRSERKKPTDILIFSLIGLFGIAGIQRFVIGHIWMGILYLLTAGLCFIGSIVDIVNHRQLAIEYNHKVADRLAGNIRLN